MLVKYSAFGFFLFGIFVAMFISNSALYASMDLYMLIFAEVASLQLIISRPSSKYLME
jgi:hypothetical protein